MTAFHHAVRLVASSRSVSATLKGIVTGPIGAASTHPLPVADQDVETGAVRNSARTMLGDIWRLSLPVGEYEVRVAKSGFQEPVRERDSPSRWTGSNRRREPASNAVKAEGGDRGCADRQHDHRDISGCGRATSEDLPLNGRSFDLLVNAEPGRGDFTWMKTGGTGIRIPRREQLCRFPAPAAANLFLLTASSFTGAAENKCSPGEPAGCCWAWTRWRFQCATRFYGAEFGKRPGGQVVIVTNREPTSGTGRPSSFLRNNAWMLLIF